MSGAKMVEHVIQLFADDWPTFHCPGCKRRHALPSNQHDPEDGGPSWEWNGDMDYPTFRPSVLVRWGKPASICHSFVTNGMIEFLPDSTHALAGQTVPLEPFDI